MAPSEAETARCCLPELRRLDSPSGSPAVFSSGPVSFEPWRSLPRDESRVPAALCVLVVFSAWRNPLPLNGHNAHPEIHVHNNRAATAQATLRDDLTEIGAM